MDTPNDSGSSVLIDITKKGRFQLHIECTIENPYRLLLIILTVGASIFYFREIITLPLKVFLVP